MEEIEIYEHVTATAYQNDDLEQLVDKNDIPIFKLMTSEENDVQENDGDLLLREVTFLGQDLAKLPRLVIIPHVTNSFSYTKKIKMDTSIIPVKKNKEIDAENKNVILQFRNGIIIKNNGHFLAVSDVDQFNSLHKVSILSPIPGRHNMTIMPQFPSAPLYYDPYVLMTYGIDIDETWEHILGDLKMVYRFIKLYTRDTIGRGIMDTDMNITVVPVSHNLSSTYNLDQEFISLAKILFNLNVPEKIALFDAPVKAIVMQKLISDNLINTLPLLFVPEAKDLLEQIKYKNKKSNKEETKIDIKSVLSIDIADRYFGLSPAELNDSQKKFLNAKIAEYDRNIQEAISESNVNCDHKKIVKEIDNGRGKLSKLEPFLIKNAINDSISGKADHMFTCQVCQTKNIICPHSILKKHLLDSGKSILPHYLIPISGTYGLLYCQVCTAVYDTPIFNNDDIDENEQEYDPALLQKINNVYFIIFRQLKIIDIIDPKLLHSDIIQTVYMPIYNIESSRHVVKSNVIVESMSRLDIIIAIYISAAFLLYNLNLQFSQEIKGSKIAAYILQFSNLISASFSSAMSNITGMTNAKVTESIIETYKSLSKKNVPSARTTEVPVTDYRTMLQYDPFFKIFLGPYELDGPYAYRELIFQVLPKGKPKDPLNLYSPLFTGKEGPIINYFMSFFKDQEFYIDPDLRKKFPEIENAEGIHNVLPLARQSISQKVPIIYSPNVPYDIRFSYDSEGNPHKWNSIFIMSNQKEFTFKEGPMVNTGGHVMPIIDQKCPVCQINYSEIAKTFKIETVRSVVYSIQDRTFFYATYKHLCPKGGRHEFENDICKKCGLHKSYIADLNVSYYDTYKKIFWAMLKDRDSRLIEETIIPTYMESPIILPVVSAALKVPWSYDISKTLVLAEKIKLGSTMARSLGAKIGKTESAISDNQFIPKEPRYNHDPRIQRIFEYIMMVLKYYGLLLNAKKNILSPNTIELIKSLKLPETVPVASTSIPNIDTILLSSIGIKKEVENAFAVFNQFLNEWGHWNHISDIANRYTEILCQVLYGIWSFNEKITEHFVTFIIETIKTIENRDLLAGHFSTMTVIGTGLYSQGIDVDEEVSEVIVEEENAFDTEDREEDVELHIGKELGW